MTGRKREKLAPSLFPFLAVLVCTLGTLILMLVLVTSNANDSARQRMESANKKIEESARTGAITQAKAKALLAEAEFRAAEFVGQRDSQTADLEQRRIELAHVDDHINRLAEELDLLNREAERAMGQSSDSVVIDQTQIEKLKAEIQQEQQQIEHSLQKKKGQPPRVVIVPHRGRNGSQRRPIYLECLANGLVIQPEGVRVSLRQLVDTERGANPLGDALQSARLHWMKIHQDPDPPYPLLVVRPDGINTYMLARIALTDWDDQFGYELVPSEVELAFPNSDPTLQQKLTQAVQQASDQQSRWVSSGAGNGRGNGSGTGNGIDHAEADGFEETDAETLLAAATNKGSSRYAAASSGTRYAASAGGGKPHVISAASLSRNGYESGFEVPSEHRRSGWNDSKRGGLSNDRSGDPLAAGDTPQLDADMEAFLNSSTVSTSQEAASSQDAASSQEAATSQEAGSADESKSSTSKTVSSSRSSTNNQDTEQDTDQDTEQASQIEGEFSSFGDGNALSDGALSKESVAGQTSVRGVGGTGGTQASGSPMSTDEQMADREKDVHKVDPEKSASGAATVNLSNPVQPGRPGWGLPQSLLGAHGNAVIRTIRLDVYEDRFVLAPASNRSAASVYSIIGSDITGSGLRMATSIRDRIESWGPATGNGRWQPRLDVNVMPGGESRFEQLDRLFRDSGYEVKRGDGS
jgi:hypothetical protein